MDDSRSVDHSFTGSLSSAAARKRKRESKPEWQSEIFTVRTDPNGFRVGFEKLVKHRLLTSVFRHMRTKDLLVLGQASRFLRAQVLEDVARSMRVRLSVYMDDTAAFMLLLSTYSALAHGPVITYGLLYSRPNNHTKRASHTYSTDLHGWPELCIAVHNGTASYFIEFFVKQGFTNNVGVENHVLKRVGSDGEVRSILIKPCNLPQQQLGGNDTLLVYGETPLDIAWQRSRTDYCTALSAHHIICAYPNETLTLRSYAIGPTGQPGAVEAPILVGFRPRQGHRKRKVGSPWAGRGPNEKRDVLVIPSSGRPTTRLSKRVGGSSDTRAALHRAYTHLSNELRFTRVLVYSGSRECTPQQVLLMTCVGQRFLAAGRYHLNFATEAVKACARSLRDDTMSESKHVRKTMPEWQSDYFSVVTDPNGFRVGFEKLITHKLLDNVFDFMSTKELLRLGQASRFLRKNVLKVISNAVQCHLSPFVESVPAFVRLLSTYSAVAHGSVITSALLRHFSSNSAAQNELCIAVQTGTGCFFTEFFVEQGFELATAVNVNHDDPSQIWEKHIGGTGGCRQSLRIRIRGCMAPSATGGGGYYHPSHSSIPQFTGQSPLDIAWTKRTTAECCALTGHHLISAYPNETLAFDAHNIDLDRINGVHIQAVPPCFTLQGSLRPRKVGSPWAPRFDGKRSVLVIPCAFV